MGVTFLSRSDAIEHGPFVWQENGELRERVAVGEVRASQLCRMESFDMATKERKEEFEKLKVRCQVAAAFTSCIFGAF